MWFFPISTGFSIIDIPLMIFAIWFFVHLYKGSKKKPKEWEPSPEQQKKWEEESQKRMEFYAETEKFIKETDEYLLEAKKWIAGQEATKTDNKKKRRKGKRNISPFKL